MTKITKTQLKEQIRKIVREQLGNKETEEKPSRKQEIYSLITQYIKHVKYEPFDREGGIDAIFANLVEDGNLTVRDFIEHEHAGPDSETYIGWSPDVDVLQPYIDSFKEYLNDQGRPWLIQAVDEPSILNFIVKLIRLNLNFDVIAENYFDNYDFD